MERNPNDPNTTPGHTPSAPGGYGTGSGATAPGSLGAAGSAPLNTGVGGTAGAPHTGSTAGTAGTADGYRVASTETAGHESHTEQLKDAAQDRLGDARERMGEAAERARGWKQSLEQTLAGKLDAGADKLRERGSTGSGMGTPGTPAYATANGNTTAGTADRAGAVEQKVAGGMEATADWLRNGDLQSAVEEQARSNPTRTLLVALGVGYLLGKALRR